jgi:hypothetical protein
MRLVCALAYGDKTPWSVMFENPCSTGRNRQACHFILNEPDVFGTLFVRHRVATSHIQRLNGVNPKRAITP